MTKLDVLDRVAMDLTRGHTQPAIQRLSSLVAEHPTDLDLRRRLAALHRMVGNRIEAGRWDYLTPGADADEVAAFERAFPSPARRLAALRWPHRGRLAAAGYARTRLDALVRAAGSRWSGCRVAARRRWWPRVLTLTLAVAGSVAAFFVLLGAVTVVQWLLT